MGKITDKKYFNKEKTAYILRINDHLLGPYGVDGAGLDTKSRFGDYYVEYEYKGKWCVTRLSKWRDVCLVCQVGTNGRPTVKLEMFYPEDTGACDCYDLWEDCLDD